MPPGLSAPATTVAPNQAAPGHVASAADSPWPPPPPTAAPPPASAAPPMPAPAPPQVSSEPKKIHTVTIRADQSGAADAAPGSTAPAAPAVARPQSRAVIAPRARAQPSGPNAPLSIIPGSQGSAPAPQRARVTAVPAAGPPMAMASTGAVPAAAPPPWRQRLFRSGHIPAQRGRGPDCVPGAPGEIPQSAQRPGADHSPRRSRR